MNEGLLLLRIKSFGSLHYEKILNSYFLIFHSKLLWFFYTFTK